MKRTLSFLLALVMVLGTFTTVFAAEPTVEEAAGALLKEFGVLQGNQDGELNLGQDLKRRDAVVLLSRLMDAEEEAEVFPADDLVFDDITDAYYKGYIAWAVSNGLAKGKSATKFDPNGALTAQHFATFLLRALGHEVEGEAYDNALETAKELGLLADVEVVNSTVVKRGVMAVMSVNALGTPMNGSEETLAVKLGLEMPVEEPTLSTDIEITAAKTVANNKVEVSVKEEVSASVADFTIVVKSDGKAVEVKDVVKESAKVFVLETEALVGGTAYTVKANGKALNFTGVALDKTAPTVVGTPVATDTNRFEITFSDVMDKNLAEKVENYTFDKDLKVVNATLDAARKVVELETDAAKTNTTYKLTIENVTNSDGVAMKKVSFNLRAKEYKTLPTVSTITLHSNNAIEIKFNASTYGMDLASLESLENYVIEGLDIVEAKAYKNAGIYDQVLLVTEEHEVNKAYKLVISGLKDASVLGNVMKNKEYSFRGKRADTSAPVVITLTPWNSNELKINFKDESGLDVASIEDLSNYKITYKDKGVDVELEVIDAKAGSKVTDLLGRYNQTNQFVTLTTEEQEDGRRYNIEISNIGDLAGNVMKTAYKGGFSGTPLDETPPTVNSAKHTDGNEIKLIFSEKVNATIAKDPTNYSIKNIGSAIKATVDSNDATGKTILLVMPALTNGTTYDLTIENIEDMYGNLMPKKVVKVVVASTGIDTTAPELLDVYADNKDEVHFIFDEAIDTSVLTGDTIVFDDFSVANVDKTFVYSGALDEGTRIVYKAQSGQSLAAIDYKVPAHTIFADKAGNSVTWTTAGDTAVKFKGTTAANEKPIVLDHYQTDVKTVTVVFNEPVKLVAGNITTNSVSVASVSKAFTSTDTHITEWSIRFNRVLKDTDNIELTFITEGIDLGGEYPAVVTGKSYMYVVKDLYYTDSEKPYIEDVVVVDNETVKVIFNEELFTPGNYEIKEEGKTTDLVTSVSLTDDNEVTIKVSPTLKASTLYTLTVKTAARDLANNASVTGAWGDFVGTNVIPAPEYIAGVALINSNKIKVTANFDLTGITVSGDVYAAPPVLTSGNKVATITTAIPFLADTEYTVTASGKTYTFEGLIEDLGIDLVAVTGEAGKFTVAYDGMDTDTYNVEVKSLANVPQTPESLASGKYTLVANDYYYVVLKDVNTGSVVYAAKVKAE